MEWEQGKGWGHSGYGRARGEPKGEGSGRKLRETRRESCRAHPDMGVVCGATVWLATDFAAGGRGAAAGCGRGTLPLCWLMSGGIPLANLNPNPNHP